MNIKQKLTLGIAAIFMITLTIVGISYAYFVTRVTGAQTTNVVITTASYGVKYGDGNQVVTLNKAMPGDKVYKSFTVTNEEKVASKFNIILTQTAGEKEFLHFDSGSDITCYQETVTKDLNNNCYTAEKYNDIIVSIVEYKGKDSENIKMANADQEKLKSAFAESTNSDICKNQNLIATNGKQQICAEQQIDAVTQETPVEKIYIMEVEFKDAQKNQNAETEASVTIKVDLD